ncbi:divalent cation tolerance protein CutA [Bacillus solimangrovi]|uniref:Cytochrome C biogenesis protein n=1 Tax=Bacillus solimangrovi TaxID=1305675 RepID=A0A1E5LJC9_9BACI|nr:divalent cation tolerance protein CutA [Bacillus solimangrovi]OEH94171.1 cytochrome C biogenesis protein [Bacillus solimangrovi]
MNCKYVKVEVLIPEVFIDELRTELNNIGVLKIGLYDNVMSYSEVKGYWRPLEGATPFDGEVGEISTGTECKVEFHCLYEEINNVKKVINDIHPYEVPVVYVIPLLD